MPPRQYRARGPYLALAGPTGPPMIHRLRSHLHRSIHSIPVHGNRRPHSALRRWLVAHIAKAPLAPAVGDRKWAGRPTRILRATSMHIESGDPRRAPSGRDAFPASPVRARGPQGGGARPKPVGRSWPRSLVMRDYLLTLVVVGLIPVAIARPWIGVLAWYWIGLMNPHRLHVGLRLHDAVCNDDRGRHPDGSSVHPGPEAGSGCGRDLAHGDPAGLLRVYDALCVGAGPRLGAAREGHQDHPDDGGDHNAHLRARSDPRCCSLSWRSASASTA